MTKAMLTDAVKRALRGANEPPAKWHTTHWGRGGSTHHAGYRVDPVPGRAPVVRVAYEASTPLPVRQLGPDSWLRQLRSRETVLRGYRRVLEGAGLEVETVDAAGGAFDEVTRRWPYLLVRPGAQEAG